MSTNDTASPIEAALTHEIKIRQAQRYHLLGDDCLVETVSQKCFLAKLMDVSLTGALISSKDRIGVEGESVVVYLRINLMDKNQIISIKSVIKTIRPSGMADILLYGIAFVDDSGELESQLKNYMYIALIQ